MKASHEKALNRASKVNREGVRRGWKDTKTAPLYERHRAKGTGGVGREESKSPYHRKIKHLRETS